MKDSEELKVMSVAEQVEQLEQMRAAGLVDDAWYHRARTQLVRRYRNTRRQRATTVEIDLRQGQLAR